MQLLHSLSSLVYAVLLCLGGIGHYVVAYRVSSEIYKYKPLPKENTLILTHVLFRHGDRTPDISTIYPKDPYANETYMPFGRGQLTLAGKERAYRLGEILRERYDRFLGPIYAPDLIEARSSSYPRTRATLTLVLASLFVPTEEFKIRENLLWQPIPFEFMDRSVDDLIATFISCEQIFHEVENVQKAPRAMREFRRNQRLYEYLSAHSGWKVNSTTLANFLHNALLTESEWGFEIPQWARKVWPEPLGHAAGEFWRYYGSTARLRQMAVGNLVGKMINDTIKKITGDLPMQRKMFLYAGHDFNIVPFMAALGNPVTETPYTAHIILEIHQINGEHFVKAYYNDYTSDKPTLLSVNGCAELCPFEEFQALMEENIPPPGQWC